MDDFNKDLKIIPFLSFSLITLIACFSILFLYINILKLLKDSRSNLEKCKS